MNRMLRKAINLLSEEQRHKLYRKMVRLPKEFLNPDFTVEIAKTQEDLEAAYALLHDCYVGIKIIDPQPSGLRCNLFSFLPTSTIIVAKLHGQVVGTVSAIKDSSSGLPSDKEFLEQNNAFRRQGKVLVEASALAVAPEHRVGHSVSFLLMKYLYNYCRHCFRGDYMMAAVHPKSEDFYKALWQFEKNGQPSQYGSLKGAAAIHISMDLSAEHFEKFEKAFGPSHPTRNLGTMIGSFDSRFHYPQEQAGLSLNPVITPAMLKYFCLEQKEVWSRMSLKEQHTLIHVYSTYFGPSSMDEFRRLDIPMLVEKEYRTPVQISSVINFGSEASFCDILDLTSKGCYVSWKNKLPKEGESISITFRFGKQNYMMRGTVAWQNDSRSLHLNRGFGIRFSQPAVGLNYHLQRSLYGTHHFQSPQQVSMVVSR